MQYKTTAPYTPDSDRAIRWDDPTIDIDWPLNEIEPRVSGRDESAPTLDDADLFD
jgi:dTDP-4-dehydrorhamnose 3,5-epimerase